MLDSTSGSTPLVGQVRATSLSWLSPHDGINLLIDIDFFFYFPGAMVKIREWKEWKRRLLRGKTSL